MRRPPGRTSQYTVRGDDAGRRLRVVVTASNEDGRPDAASSLTAPVPPAGTRTVAGRARRRAPTGPHPGALDPVTTPATVELTVDPAGRHQAWLGAGGALTDSSVADGRGWPEPAARPLRPARPPGRGSTSSGSLSATDFSTRPWTWQDDPAQPPAPPPEAERAVGLLLEAAERQPHLGVVAAAWSAPAWMKDSGRLNGGGLAPGREPAYADLLTAQAAALRDAGVPLVAMSLGNEPGHSNPTYPTMTMTDTQLTALAQAGRRPAGRARGRAVGARPQLGRPSPARRPLLAAAPGRYTAAAFHCYAGDPAAMGGLAIPPS